MRNFVFRSFLLLFFSIKLHAFVLTKTFTIEANQTKFIIISSEVKAVHAQCEGQLSASFKRNLLPISFYLNLSANDTSLICSVEFITVKQNDNPVLYYEIFPDHVQIKAFETITIVDRFLNDNSDITKKKLTNVLQELIQLGKSDDIALRLTALIRLTLYYQQQFNFKVSNEYAKELRRLTTDDKKTNFLATIIMAKNKFSLYKFVDAELLLKNWIGTINFELLDIDLKIELLTTYGFAQIHVGNIQTDQKIQIKGKQLLLEVQQLCIASAKCKSQSDIYNGLATYYKVTGNLTESARFLELAIKNMVQDRSQSSIDTLSSLTNNLAIIYQQTGDLAKSQHFLRRSIYFEKKLKNPISLTISYANLANSYRLLGDIPKAKRFYQQSLTLSIKAGDQFNIGLNKLELGQLNISIGEYPQAIISLTDALPIIEQYTSQKSSFTKVQLALANLRNGDQNLASNMLEHILRFDYSTLNIIDKTDLQLSLLELAIELKDPNSADTLAKEIDEAQLQSTSSIIHWHKLRFKKVLLDIELSKIPASVFDLSKQLELIFNQVHSEVMRTAKSLDSEEIGLSWVSQVNQLFDLYMEFLLNSDDIENHLKAWELSERTTNLIIQKRRRYYSGRTEKQTKNNDELNAKIQMATLNILSAEVDTQNKNQYILDHLREKKLLNNGLVKDNNEISVPLLSMTDTQKLIAEDTRLIKYVLVKQQYFVFWLSQHDWGVQKLPHSIFKQLKSYISTESEANSINSFNFTSEAILPRNITGNTDVKKLIIIPDGDLHLFPFVALRDDKHDYLTENWQIVRALSASSYFDDSLNSQVDSTRGIGIFSDPEFNIDQLRSSTTQLNIDWRTQFQRLPWTAEITPYLQELFHASNVKYVSGAQATNNALLSESMRQTKVLHIATHAYYDKNSPELVGLVTAQPTEDSSTGNTGYLSIYDILEKPFYSQLIIISACESQMGRNYGGEGVRGLAYSMLAQGAGSVIGTLWKVPDKPTALFMRYFYKDFRDNGGNSVKALQSARHTFIRSGRYKHPKYWAGFVLTVANRQYETIKLNYD